MKRLNRIFTAIVAVMMIIAGKAIYVQAGDGDFSIEIEKNSSDKASHTYGAYQLFTGEITTEDQQTILSNITWGTNIDSAAFIAGLNNIKEIDTLSSDSSASDVAKAISDANITTDSETARLIASAANTALNSAEPAGTVTIAADGTKGTITGLTAGYYLIKDTTDVSGQGASTRYVLRLTGDTKVIEKASVPSVIKKVKEKNDTTGEESSWQDGADYDIGDAVPFQLTATTASTVSDYKTYHVTFQDKQSAGLSNPASYTITVLGKTLTLNADATEAVTDSTADGTSIQVSNVTPESGYTFAVKVTFTSSTDGAYLASECNSIPVVVEYTSVLNSSAVIGSAGNPNDVYLSFSNNPNSTDDQQEGTTPVDRVTVFTYEIKALKAEPDGSTITTDTYNALSDTEKAGYLKVGDTYQKTRALSGAGLTLYKKVPVTVESSGYILKSS